MTVKDLIDLQIFEVLNEGTQQERTISTIFTCDLLSVAMGSAPAGCIWVTVMGNINTLAVAALADAAGIVLAHNTALDQTTLNKARQEDITLLRTELPIFDAALRLYKEINEPA